MLRLPEVVGRRYPHLQVDLSLSLPQPGNEHEPEKTLAVATGIFTKIGALRAM